MNVELCETASVMKEKAEKRKKRACFFFLESQFLLKRQHKKPTHNPNGPGIGGKSVSV